MADGNYLIGFFAPKFQEEGMYMNKNPKEKTVQILIRAKPKDKEKIKRIAVKCNLSVSEYMLQRALGYEPKTLLPENFYECTEKIGVLHDALGTLSSTELQAEVLKLIDEIHAKFLATEKSSGDE